MPFAKKSLGQNFLISPRIVGAIVSAGDLKVGETVIEIGPGKGILTRALLESGAHVKAVEKDDRLIPILAKVFEKEIADKKLELIHDDIMKFDAENLNKNLNLESPYKLIANIPYYITGTLIRNFLSAKIKPSLMVLMVQREVADRIIARDGKESILSLSVKAYAKPELVMNVSRGNFFPIPNVDSAVIKLSNIQNPFVNGEGIPDKTTENRFFEIVRAGFAQKRKKLISNLEKVMPEEMSEEMTGETSKEKLEILFEKLGLDENIRAEDVPLETWLKISQTS
ncbi:MAG: 16S rRNA (adenine(1518)-N(6)/adenine(1519)-N(6))-dimethyltransferase RsmA [bacterium]|nr:16S rRNA (adenine(1518)-N(6)/adenine(1519)-N(6))-dimethyltransferase RsmA [bacterium]